MPIDERLYIAGNPLDGQSERVERLGAELQGHLGVGDARRNGGGVPTTVAAELLGADTTGTVQQVAAPALATGAGAASTFTVTYVLPTGATQLLVVVRRTSDNMVYGKVIAGASVATITLAGVPANTSVTVEVIPLDASGRAGRGRAGTVTTHA